MPSGKTHDSVTFLLTIPAFAVVYSIYGFLPAAVFTVTFLCGGLFFGPDLDTVSVQYRRWGPLRVFWLPYRTFFSHRSRWSHGILFGTLIRIIYFAGVITLVSFAVASIVAMITGVKEPGLMGFVNYWSSIGDYLRSWFGVNWFFMGFGGLWFGALSHTAADAVGTYIRTGKFKGYL